MERSRSTSRTLFACAAVLFGGRAALGCDSFGAAPLGSDEAGSPDAHVDSGSAPTDDSGGVTLPDGAVLDASPDAPVSCRSPLIDHFDGPSWTPALWTGRLTGGTASISTTSGGVSGDALRVSTTSSTGADFGYLMLEPKGECPLTVDFQFRLQSGAVRSLIILELVSKNRARLLSIEDEMGVLTLVLKGEDGQHTFNAPFQGGAFHQVVLRYERSGAMTLRLDNLPPLNLPASSTEEPADRIRIGNLGATESSSPGSGQTLLFDDVRIE
jgi:hypothetical protein